MTTPAILVHGGSGNIPAERHARLREGCRAAAEAGNAVLERGGDALDAVVAAVRVLEDDVEFNAGNGSVLTREGTVETEAAVMDGATRRIGAVGAVPDCARPVELARMILEDGEHVLLVGEEVWRWAAERGIARDAAGALITDRACGRLVEWWKERERAGTGTGTIPGTEQGDRPGTVGAVARDTRGKFAAATSTGGILGKRCGRVGDSPIAGAGTWADDAIAISATGDGEAIVRVALAHEIARCGLPLKEAVEAGLAALHRITKGRAGVIALDAAGISFAQLSEAMPIAWISGTDRGDSAGRRHGT